MPTVAHLLDRLCMKLEQHRQYLGYNDLAFQHLFYHGFKEEVKDELAHSPRPATLRELKEAAIYLDVRLYKWLLEKRASASHPAQARMSTSNRNTTPIPTATLPIPQTVPAGPMPVCTASFPAYSPDGTVPMEIGSHGKWQLTRAEKARRKQLNLCDYCASPSQDVMNCPTKPKSRFDRQAVMAVELEECWEEAKDDTQE